MNETRYDWLTDRWVIFAPNRYHRPDEFRRSPDYPVTSATECPFCVGAEHETPEPTLVLPEVDYDMTLSNRRTELAKLSRPNWCVRVVPNKFPAIRRGNLYPSFEAPNFDDLSPALSSSESIAHSHPSSSDVHWNLDGGSPTQEALLTTTTQSAPIELFQRRTASGAHEVIIESPVHIDSMTSLSVPHIAMILEAYRRRLNHWRAQLELKYGIVFKNFGADAGASLFHSHSQLISSDFVPGDVARIYDRLVRFEEEQGICYACRVIAEECSTQQRVVMETTQHVVICPFASQFPYGFTIYPKAHRSRFEENSANDLHEFAQIIKRALTALESALPNTAYNFVLHTSPFRGNHEVAHHWRLTVIPRISKVAGFEWGSDCFINHVLPERAAEVLRAHWPR